MSNSKEIDQVGVEVPPTHSCDWRKCSDVPADIMEECEQDSLAPAAVLRLCKRKVLLPYLHLLALSGLRSSPPRLLPPFRRTPYVLGSPCFGSLETDGSWCTYILTAVDVIHFIFILLLMVLGYILQYLACFQHIGGFCLDCGACGTINVSFITYIIPAFLQIAAHCHIAWLFRFQEVERLPNLMERVFLLSSGGELNGTSRHQSLVCKLWFLILSGILWGFFSIGHMTWIIYSKEDFHILSNPIDSSLTSNAVKMALIVGMGCQEVSKAVIITSYCIHAYLLSYYLKVLHCSLLCRGQSPLDWMREVAEFQGLLKHFNKDLSPSAVVISSLSLAWSIAGAVRLIYSPLLYSMHSWVAAPINVFNNQSSLAGSEKITDSFLLQNESLPVNNSLQPVDPLDVMNIILKSILALAPLIQAARVSSACRELRGAGHAVRARPFAYRNAPPSPLLDSLLMYTSSLRLSATLLPCTQLSVTPSCLFVSIFLTLLIPVTILMLITLVYEFHKPQI